MSGLQVGIAAVLGVAGAVVLEADDVVRRLGDAAELATGLHAVGALARPVFVDVVAELHHSVDPLELGQVVVGVEQAGRVEGAGDHRQHHLVGGSARQGAGAAYG